MAELNVQLVAAERAVWSGTARLVVARTVDGDLGVMPGHQPLLGELADGVVVIRTTEGTDQVAAVHGGFISVESNQVSLLAEDAELASEIDVEAAKADLESSGSEVEDLREIQRRAETRLRAAEFHL